MKILTYFIFLIMLYSCVPKKGTYWCGDHPCINKKEQKTYFKKNMTVEFRKFKKDNKNEKSEIEKITKQAKIDQEIDIIKEKTIKKKC